MTNSSIFWPSPVAGPGRRSTQRRPLARSVGAKGYHAETTGVYTVR